VDGELLLVSQFTLYADCKRRPRSFLIILSAISLVSVSATPISTRNPLPMLPVTSPSTFTSAFAVIYAAIKAVVNTFLRKKDLPVETVKYSYLKNIDEEGFHQLPSEYRDRKNNPKSRKSCGITKNLGA